jgi:hypothetical protein
MLRCYLLLLAGRSRAYLAAAGEAMPAQQGVPFLGAESTGFVIGAFASASSLMLSLCYGRGLKHVAIICTGSRLGH